MDAVAASRAKWLLIRVGICVGVFCTPVFAAPDAPSRALRMKARTLFADGQKALDSGDVQTAEKDFEEAYKTLPNAAVLLKIADCRSRLSDDAGAVDALQRYLAERQNAPDRAEVESRINAIKQKPAVVSVTTTPTGATILVDGSDSGQVTPADLKLAPGDHTIAVQLAQYETIQQSITVEFASRKRLELTLAAPARQATEPGLKAGTDDGSYPISTSGGRNLSPAFWVAVGGTVVGAAVTTTFGLMALDKHSDYQKKPTRALYDDGRRDALISDIALGVTVASAVTAGVLFFTAKSGDEPPDHHVVVVPCIERGGGSLVGHVRF
jgi:hypothetical protein